jgi:hypothetical protein
MPGKVLLPQEGGKPRARAAPARTLHPGTAAMAPGAQDTLPCAKASQCLRFTGENSSMPEL